MDKVFEIFNYIKDNMANISTVIAYLIAVASIIVKMTPTLKDDNALKAVIAFIGKYIALDKYGPDGKE